MFIVTEYAALITETTYLSIKGVYLTFTYPL